MSSGEDLVLLIGDFYIPTRKPSIPKQFRELLNTDKIRHVLCTGNIGSLQVLDMLQRITPNVHTVRGDTDTDEVASDFPEYEVVEIGCFRIGLVHGHQELSNSEILSEWQRRLDCDILVSGNTHQNSAEKIRGRFYINPGSATGAYRPKIAGNNESSIIIPSFMLMSIRGNNIVLYVYELRNGKVNVAMSDFSKDDIN